MPDAKDNEDYGKRLLALIEDRDLWKQSEETCSRQYDKLAERCERLMTALVRAESDFHLIALDGGIGFTLQQNAKLARDQCRDALKEDTGE